jgi:hypothetical protein
MIVGPVLAIGGIIALFVVLGAPTPAPWSIIMLLAIAAVWKLSLLFGPEKKCWRCKGQGWRSGLIGGRITCSQCSGSGRRPRIGAK